MAVSGSLLSCRVERLSTGLHDTVESKWQISVTGITNLCDYQTRKGDDQT